MIQQSHSQVYPGNTYEWTKGSKSDRERQILDYITYMWNLKMVQMYLFITQKKTHTYRKQTYGYQRGKGGKEGQIRSEGLTDTYILLYIK